MGKRRGKFLTARQGKRGRERRGFFFSLHSRSTQIEKTKNDSFLFLCPFLFSLSRPLAPRPPRTRQLTVRVLSVLKATRTSVSRSSSSSNTRKSEKKKQKESFFPTPRRCFFHFARVYIFPLSVSFSFEPRLVFTRC